MSIWATGDCRCTVIAAQLQDEKPFRTDPDYTGEYPAEAPFTISELERIYPAASARSKGGRSLRRPRA